MLLNYTVYLLDEKHLSSDKVFVCKEYNWVISDFLL